MARIARGMAAARAAVVSAPFSKVLRFRPQLDCDSDMVSPFTLGIIVGGLRREDYTALIGLQELLLDLFEKAANRRDHAFLFVLAQLREDGEGEHLAGGALALRKFALAIAKEGQGFLLMKRERIVDLRPDAALCKPCAQLVPARNPDDVLMEDMMGARVGPGQNQAVIRIGAGLDESGGGEELAIACGQGAAPLVPPIPVTQFHQQNRSLQSVQPAVPADFFVVIADLHAMCTETADAPGEDSVRSGDHAGLAGGTQVLCGIKAE